MSRSNVVRMAGLAAVIGVALVACAGPAASPGATAPDVTPTPNLSVPSEPVGTPSAECVNPPRDVLTLINQTDPVSCYGDAPITVGAHVIAIGAIDCAPVRPSWLSCEAWVGLEPIRESARTNGVVLAETSGPPGLPWMFAAIHPETLLISQDIVGRSLRITGHYDDPLAQTCTQTEGAFGEPPDPVDEIIAWCRSIFVLTGFEAL